MLARFTKAFEALLSLRYRLRTFNSSDVALSTIDALLLHDHWKALLWTEMQFLSLTDFQVWPESGAFIVLLLPDTQAGLVCDLTTVEKDFASILPL